MISLNLRELWLHIAAVMAFAVTAGLGVPAYAQDEAPPAAEEEQPAAEEAAPAEEEAAPAEEEAAPTAEEVIEEAEEEAAVEDKIVVTGSRIRRDAFTSTAPLQVIDSETIAEAGLVDLGEILRATTVVQGVQLDLQVNSEFVTNAGPGGQAVALRGLDPERTLVLINGRRFAPAGVEGAPTLPDISLIPSAMIERIDVLLDGASSVYGSDAVAGVANIILRREFDGVAIEGFYSQPEDTGGTEQQYSLLMGVTADKGKFLIGAEYVHNEELRGNEREWMASPNRDCDGVPVDFDRPTGAFQFGGVDILQCDDGRVLRFLGTSHASQQFVSSPFGFLTGRPGTNEPAFGFIPDFENANFSTDKDVSELFSSGFALNQDQMVLGEFQRTSIYVTADYDIMAGVNAFVEFNFSNRQTTTEDRFRVIDAVLTPTNPFNPLGPAIIENLELIEFFGIDPDLTTRPLQPWRNQTFVELDQYRLIGGFKGGLGATGVDDWGFFRASQWDYELFFGYTRSQGFSEREILREEALLRALTAEVDPATGAIVCSDVLPNPDAAFSSGQTLEPCVPFNPLFPGLWVFDGTKPFVDDPRIIDFLRGVRSVTTFVDQSIVGGYLTGPAFKLPAGDVQAVVGFEWRQDSIDTRSDDTAARGLGAGFFLDRPTVGSASLTEVFGELEFPLVAGKRFAHDLNVSLAGRLTDHEFYGQNTTYSVKGRYSPQEWLTFRGTAGTSFRAPNLRELFLAGQSGFAFVTDPCLVPLSAQVDTDEPPDGLNDSYDPGPNGENEPRSQQVLDNCQAEGLDPFSLGIGISVGTPEIFRAGNTNLDPERSFAWSAGAVLEQPWIEDLDVRIGFNYWDINIIDSVLVPSASFLVVECYNSDNFPDDPFCTRRQRDPNTGFLAEVDTTPFNIAEESAHGFDLNLFVGKEFRIGSEQFNFEVDVVSTYAAENSLTIVLEGVTDFSDNAGTIGFPYWRGLANARLRWQDWTLFWRTRYIGEQQPNLADIPSNCQDPLVEACFTVADILYHDVSVNWTKDTWSVRVGVNNVLNEDPPQIDEDVALGFVQGARQVPVGVGYDRIGRRFFFNVTKQF